VSEFSCSYHIRTDDARDALQRLRKAKISGLAFGPANGWLTFVPYANLAELRGHADSPLFAQRLSRLTGSEVLHYRFAEDHGWMFALAREGTIVSQFAGWWDPISSVEREQLDLKALTPLVSAEALEPLLEPFDAGKSAEEQPAYRFADLLGLPAYKWLSPELAQGHTDELLDQGGRKIGTKPPGTDERLRVPPARDIVLPRPDPSAREALAVLEATTTPFRSPWHLASLCSYARINPEGRGDWRFSYRCGDTGDVIHAHLMAEGTKGRVAYGGVSMPYFGLSDVSTAVPLPEEWLDSTAIAALVVRQPVPHGLIRAQLGSLSLTPRQAMPLCWQALWFTRDRDSEFATWTVEMNATDARVIAESLGRRHHQYTFTARRRLAGGAWEDLPPPDWVAGVEEDEC
jgi:hypothetical protein